MYHPNIDLEGNVCLNILREDWKPVLSINSVIYGLQFLFLVRCLDAGFRAAPDTVLASLQGTRQLSASLLYAQSACPERTYEASRSR